MATFYIIRHAESTANIQGKYGLTPRARLTTTGVEQATALRRQLFSRLQVDLIFSSNLLRAKQTAAIIATEKKLAVTTTVALKERSYGRLNGKTKHQIQKQLGELYTQYQERPDREKFYTRLVDDMETVEETLDRVIRFIRQVAVAHPDKTVAMVSHSTVMRALLIHLGWADHHEIDSGCIANTAYLKIETDGIDFFIKETWGIKKKTS